MNIDDRYKSLCIDAASKLDVVSNVHSEDMIFRFIINNRCFSDEASAVNYYFNDGCNSSKKILDLINNLGQLPDKIKLLEFASGYGCVSRHLAKYKDRLDLTCCDIHLDAINFLHDVLCIDSVLLSSHHPNEFDCNAKYDVVFALSFFSHMPLSTWGAWLKALYDALTPGGYLVFTTQGVESAKFFGYPEIDINGFWFAPQSEQEDLDTAEYGQTICTSNFVINEIQNKLNDLLIMYQHAAWWNHQDLYIVKKCNKVGGNND